MAKKRRKAKSTDDILEFGSVVNSENVKLNRSVRTSKNLDAIAKLNVLAEGKSQIFPLKKGRSIKVLHNRLASVITYAYKHQLFKKGVRFTKATIEGGEGVAVKCEKGEKRTRGKKKPAA